MEERASLESLSNTWGELSVLCEKTLSRGQGS